MCNLRIKASVIIFLCICRVLESVSFAEPNRPLLKPKRTCEDCRRLADKGAYEQSIKAYQEFIETNKDSYQIDDAFLAIADIYDTKLFDFENALKWYRRLIKDYPDSTLDAVANQRIKYISAYADYDYKPLVSFERIRTFEYSQKKDRPAQRDKILDDVKTLIAKYPDSNLAPVMQYWLANQYKLISPQKAIDAYMTLRKNYPDKTEARETMIEIGETYYTAGKYSEAIAAFNQALKETPDLAKTIKMQIARCYRNIRRDQLSRLCWIICVFIAGAVFLSKPRDIKINKIFYSVAVFIIAASLLFLTAWVKHEQFNSTNQILLFIFLFSFVIALGTLISTSLANKFKSRNFLPTVFGAAAGIIFLLAGLYLTIYYVYVHYLIVFKL